MSEETRRKFMLSLETQIEKLKAHEAEMHKYYVESVENKDRLMARYYLSRRNDARTELDRKVTFYLYRKSM